MSSGPQPNAQYDTDNTADSIGTSGDFLAFGGRCIEGFVTSDEDPETSSLELYANFFGSTAAATDTRILPGEVVSIPEGATGVALKASSGTPAYRVHARIVSSS